MQVSPLRASQLSPFVAGMMVLGSLCVTCGTPPEKPLVAEPEQVKKNIQIFEITSAKQVGGTVVVEGRTDLPDGAEVSSSVQKVVAPSDTYIGSEADAVVADGKWSATIEFPKVSAFRQGKHEVEAMFTPKGAPLDVETIVGPSGENLSGPSAVKNELGFNTMSDVMPLKLSFGSSSKQSVVADKRFARTAPLLLAIKVLNLWIRRDWAELARNGTTSRRTSFQEKLKLIESNVGFGNLASAEILDVETAPARTVITFSGATEIGARASMGTTTLVLLKKDRNGVLSESGQWKVNLSVLFLPK